MQTLKNLTYYEIGFVFITFRCYQYNKINLK